MMEFKNYYDILEVPFDVDNDLLRKSYLRLAKKWHPDKHQNKDTNTEMQLIVEAYLILKDTEARHKYDAEFKIYYNKIISNEQKSTVNGDRGYTFSDAELESWIINAQNQSIQIASKLVKEIREQFKIGIKGALNEMLPFKIW